MYKTHIRKFLAVFLYQLYYRWQKKTLHYGYQNNRLKQGITAVISAKDEEYILEFCLKSLIGVADQVVCIDNGSSDRTLEVMENFKKNYSHQIEVDVISMPGALLGDCRNAGLKASRYQWHLRWDADMVCKTSGNDSMFFLRDKTLMINRPMSFQLPRTNLIGDFNHTSKTKKVVDPGEPILVWYNNDIMYKEYGKFDALKIPFYYKQVKETKRYYYHCQGIKPATNLIHRFHYFKWRELVNNFGISPYNDDVNDYEEFKKCRNLHLFGTNERLPLTWRYYRQLSHHFIKYDSTIYGEYPDVINDAMANNKERFKVIYIDEIPYTMTDSEDIELIKYQPTLEDINWDINVFFKKLSEENNFFHLKSDLFK